VRARSSASVRVKRARKTWTSDCWTVVVALRGTASEQGQWVFAETRRKRVDAPLLSEALCVLEEVAGALVGPFEFGLDLVAADVHGVEVRLEHAELLWTEGRGR